MAEKLSNSLTNKNDDHLVWLDENIENYSNKQKLNQLRELDDKIKCFTDKQQCVDYIEKQDISHTKSSIILITSGSFSEEILPQIHDCRCIVGIFIFCTNSERFQDLKFPKLRAICTDTYELFDRIQNYVNRDKFAIDFSLFNNQKSTNSGN
jgi:hypothetical protein